MRALLIVADSFAPLLSLSATVSLRLAILGTNRAQHTRRVVFRVMEGGL
jgi:hypothetical protein